MSDSTVVIVGAGHAGVQVAASLRQHDSELPIVLIGDEDGMPYQRPPLSKDFLNSGGLRQLDLLRPAEFFQDNDIALRQGHHAVALHREAREVELSSGERIGYANVVLATGARPRPLAVDGNALPGVHYLATAQDARDMAPRLTPHARVVVVGAGFIGLEVAAAARKLGSTVTVLEAARRSMSRALSPESADFLVSEHRRAGVDVLTGTVVDTILGDQRDGVTGVRCTNGVTIAADLVVIGIGVVAADGLARQAHLPTDNGIIVDEMLRTEDPAIWAVGDCCRFPTSESRSIRLESVQNASDQAKAVAQSIVGTPTPFAAVPWFWTTQFGHKVQIAGLLDGYDSHVLRRESASSFSVLLYRGSQLVAVESINRPLDHLAARKLLAAGISPSSSDAADLSVDLRVLARQVA
ncbi:FAD-dependent oxidoreductase [Rhodococcus sp. IEGM 1381]|uniref:NAD(P)/FAD-dependent oxidoreductase n=1 Tax=Rhodococcus sp. IEGM 1381 TaxID=3047085 RepID=UPI0024B6A235|nr:FAD-dependent oxidoreductase [Rhodococcus sp. IEGM 1381]MDI9897406.1 FAD-dependent oxidoreductase [Rhodococcus sp. IEGM 1381]